MLCVPLIAFAPLQLPDAVQDVALLEFQVKVAAPPLATVEGFAVREAVALPGTVTATVAMLLVPPDPIQVKEYSVVAATAPVSWLPLVASVPLHPPVAAHEVALLDVHVSVDVAPCETVVGFAVSVTAGRGATLMMAVATLLVPPVPLQIREYEVVVVSGPMVRLPLGARAPLQPPDAVHDTASVEFQVSMEMSPLATAACAALRDTVGGSTLAGVTTTPPHAASTKEEATAANRKYLCKARRVLRRMERQMYCIDRPTPIAPCMAGKSQRNMSHTEPRVFDLSWRV